MANTQSLYIARPTQLTLPQFMAMVVAIRNACDKEVLADREKRGLAETRTDRFAHRLTADSAYADTDIQTHHVTFNFNTQEGPGSLIFIPEYRDKMGVPEIDEAEAVCHLGMGWNERATRLLDAMATKLQEYGDCYRVGTDEVVRKVDRAPVDRPAEASNAPSF